MTFILYRLSIEYNHEKLEYLFENYGAFATNCETIRTLCLNIDKTKENLLKRSLKYYLDKGYKFGRPDLCLVLIT